jgi:two-component system sensor histidine kinase PilS (NtrC family)
MTARVALGLVLLLLQTSIYVLGGSRVSTPVAISAGYFGAALVIRLWGSPRRFGPTFDLQWISTLGVDLLAFVALQVTHGNSINYSPLFVLPVLMASVLGSLLFAMGTSAVVTLLLFAYAGWITMQISGDGAAHFMQAALTGAGCFVISFLAHQIASRLVNVELLAQRSELAARVQQQVNELVIESMTDGILVLDQRGLVRAANPAARLLLGGQRALKIGTFELASVLGWMGLVDLMRLSFSSDTAQQADVTIRHAGLGPQRLRVRTQLTATNSGSDENLCVMFLQDQREMEARMRTEKMASMGRMSAAVAHEIRNPLAAITQANSLLDEDLSDPKYKQLTKLVQQNARRLEKIVEEVLNIARVRQSDHSLTSGTLELNAAVTAFCQDWQSQARPERSLQFNLLSKPINIGFEPEHLRRILVNLLDNASRYASQRLESIQVSTNQSAADEGTLSVWSDGQPMEPSVERHLFEPFFSSESRSSGLGLYICRELCEGYGASIAYNRTQRNVVGRPADGNEFLIVFRAKPAKSSSPQDSNGLPGKAWQQTSL